MAAPFYPFTLRCNDRGWSEYGFRNLFLKIKPEGRTWFAYDVVVLSRNLVRFDAYGRRRDKIFSVETVVPYTEMEPYILRRARQLAEERRDKELLDAEELLLQAYARDVFEEQA